MSAPWTKHYPQSTTACSPVVQINVPSMCPVINTGAVGDTARACVDTSTNNFTDTQHLPSFRLFPNILFVSCIHATQRPPLPDETGRLDSLTPPLIATQTPPKDHRLCVSPHGSARNQRQFLIRMSTAQLGRRAARDWGFVCWLLA